MRGDTIQSTCLLPQFLLFSIPTPIYFLLLSSSPASCNSCETLKNSPTSTIGTVQSDPHFNGFHNQSYDFTGESGHMYSILSDKNMAINARFSTAYVTGTWVDPSQGIGQNMRPQGTWMNEVGFTYGDNTLQVCGD